ncbi:alpha/beta fold hydrolase [Ciceribacter sp. T2.26MG-112.2]|uniref:alpha/beta fold hydrolase n=1 Tax=Ciceribacter sp. T2.26MG-112.2 TaxID=3137154 RepID=UPI0012B69776|nr:alpha/beta fold hydrolase [Ciceribacter naphthalenivorans]
MAFMRTFLTSLAIVLVLISAASGYVWWNYDAVVTMILKPQTATAGDITEESFGLVTPDGKRFALGDLQGALSNFEPSADGAPRPLVLFVHGFGPDPDGEFGLYTMGELAKGAGADVLMFNWPSWISMTEFPVLNARAASERLIALLHDMADLSGPGQALADRPVMIVGHSMAGELFRHVGEASPDLPRGLVARILFAVPETALPDHRLWMEKLSFADEIFVFVNADDPALQVTTRMYNTARLGRTLTNLDGSPEPLAQNADYILLDPESWRHYFFVSGQRSEAIDQIFADILRNGTPALNHDYLRPEPADNVFLVVGPGAEGF